MKAYYSELESSLLLILNGLQDQMNGPQRREVMQFVEAGEYGLAFETLCFVLRDERLTLPASLHDKFVALAGLLGTDAEFWRELVPGAGSP